MSELRLHANENPWGPSPRVADAVAQQALARYPEEPGALERALARRLDIDPARVVVGNGLTELISLLILALTSAGDTLLTPAGGFVAYQRLARAAGRVVTLAPARAGGGCELDALRLSVSARTRIVLLANPDNPTGTFVRGDALRRFVAALAEPRPIVVVDEAYREYVRAPGFPAPRELLDAGVIILRTFSKAYGLAGVRCGYCVAPRELAARLRAVGGPYRVGRLARAAARVALEDDAHLERVVQRTARERAWLRDSLRALGLSVSESHASFLLVRVGARAEPIVARLRAGGIRVRPLSAYGWPDALRVSVARRRENQRLVLALREALRPVSAAPARQEEVCP